ncbi:hypothetical protein LJB88_05525 [Erysipelotrichaceae bacterium OttesenSCG-928-M19]|nr:hypothetical protein [Erysipelotrichaceae bacterium OttesenSCG-928-M19]
MELNLDLNEIKRYLKYDTDILDEVTQNNLVKALALVKEVVQPKYISQKYPLTIKDNEVIIEQTVLTFNSIDLRKHLQQCDEVVLLVATLGLELDKLIKKLEITDLSLAYLVNGVAIEYLEKYLDYLQENELAFAKNQTARYSIGYGDLDLSYQEALIKVLDATKKIGVNVLPSHLMIPSKSVSAIIGLSHHQVTNDLRKCPNCLASGKCSNRCIGKDE